MRIKNSFLILFLFTGYQSFADIGENLNNLQLNQEIMQINAPENDVRMDEMPYLKDNKIEFDNSKLAQVFDYDRLNKTNSIDPSTLNNNYDIRQLQMLGTMTRGNSVYAFLKTPYDTKLVKEGDKIQNAKVIKITDNEVEISEILSEDGKEYNKHVYLKYDDNSLSNKLKYKLGS